MDVSTDRKFKMFIQNRTVRESTIKKYKIDIQTYSDFIKQSPSEFIEEALTEEDNGIRLSNRKIKEYLLDYKDYLIKNDYSPRTIITKLTTIKFFYAEFDVVTPKIRYSKKNLRRETIEDLPTKDDIRLAMSFSNIKYQAIMLTMLSSGMRASDIRHLTYHDFLKSISEYCEIPLNTMVEVDVLSDMLQRNNETKIITWKIVTIKNNTPVTTFSTPECFELLMTYLKNDPPKSLESYLFPSSKYPKNPISERAFAHYFNNLNRLCKFGKIDRLVKFRSHTFRKIFATTLMNQGLQQLTISRLLGHSVKDLTESYIKKDDSTLKQQYLLCVPALSLEKTEVNSLTTDDKRELISMRKELDEMKEVVKMVKAQKELEKPSKN